MKSDSVIVEIKNLKKVFGSVRAVDVKNLTLNKGEIVGLVGNNGAGKTTLMRLMLDLIEANSGSVCVAGMDVSKTEEWKSMVGAYLDSSFLIEFYTAKEYLEFVCDAYSIEKSLQNEAIGQFKTFFGDEALFENKYIRDLSAGNKQKVGIASAIISHPDVIILDEPFNYLDPTSQVMANKILKKEAERGALVLVSTHNLAHVTDLCTRVLLMEKSEIIKDLSNENSVAEKTLSEYFNI